MRRAPLLLLAVLCALLAGSTAPATAATAATPGVTAVLAAQDGALQISWHLRSGSSRVEAVRIVRTGAARDGSVESTVDRPAVDGRIILRGLLARHYTVTVAPVVDEVPGRAVVLGGSPTGPVQAGVALPASLGRPDLHHASGYAPPSTPAGWRRVLVQDFGRSTALGSFARAYPGWAGYDGNTDTSRETARPRDEVGIWNSATTTSVHGGLFDCRLHTQGRRPQVCALTPMRNGGPGQRYGRYSVRFRTDRIPGYKVAWLLWPASNRWTEGELDFPEAALDGTVTGAVHRVDGDPADVSFFIDTKQRTTAWHTATIEWAPGHVTFVLDGRSWTTSDARGLPTHPMRWALQAETAIRAQPPGRSVQGHILIDWVVGYRPAA